MSGHDLLDGDARILDRGYRRYTGVRTGTRGAVDAVVRHSLQRSLGMRRTVWAKVFPILVVALAYVPAIVFVGIIALLPARETADLILPTYGDYYGFVISAIMLFTAFVAPEVMCTDRRTGMLGIYLAAPLDRRTYLVAKALAIGVALSLVCVGPPLLMLVANVLQSSGPEGAADIASTAFDVLAAGLALTLLFTGLTMGITSLTDRKWVATTSIMLLYLVLISVAGTLELSGAPEAANAVSPTLLAMDLAQRIHGEYTPIMPTVPTATVWLAWAAWTFGGFGAAWYRLKTLPVTR